MIHKLVFVTDIHVADHAPLGRKGDYATHIINKLRAVGDHANEIGAAAILVGGDVFHHKRPNQVSHGLMQRLIPEFQRWPDTYVVPGNHDMGPAELNSLDRQPLGVLARSGAVKLLDSPQVCNTLGAALFIPRPYSMAGDADPDYYTLTKDEHWKIVETTPQFVIMVAHGSLLPPGQIRPYPHITIDQVDWTGVSVVLCGHIHENLGIHTGSVLFANPGSLGRVARTVANYTRKVGVIDVTLDTETGGITLEHHALAGVLPFDEVFEGESADGESRPSDEVQELAAALVAGLDLEEVSVEEVIAESKASDPVKKILYETLAEAGIG